MWNPIKARMTARTVSKWIVIRVHFEVKKMDIISILAEEKISEGVKNGAFDNLPGKGRPLELEDLSGVPEELRTGYKMMKNAGFLPEELQIRKEMATLNDLIRCCDDERERASLNQRLSEKKIRFNQLMETREIKKTRKFHQYRNKIYRRLGM